MLFDKEPTIEEKVARYVVKDKSQGKKGLIFKKDKYSVSLDPVHGIDITKAPQTTEVPLCRYQEMEVGKEIDVTLYSGDKGKTWWFEKEYAYLTSPTR